MGFFEGELTWQVSRVWFYSDGWNPCLQTCRAPPGVKQKYRLKFESKDNSTFLSQVSKFNPYEDAVSYILDN